MEIFELVPIVLIILWSVLGAKGAKKKQEEARRRAEADRRAREAQRARLESGGMDGPILEEARASGPARTSDSSTAADMVPDELWAILTGGAPPPTRPREPMPAPVETRAERVPEGGWVTSPPWDEEDALDSVEGVSAEEIGDEIVDYDAAADSVARARYENVRRFSWDDTNPEIARAAASETDQRRHVDFHDKLRAGEIGGAAGPAAPSARERLGIAGIADVRRAIVLIDVLGPPKAMQ